MPGQTTAASAASCFAAGCCGGRRAAVRDPQGRQPFKDDDDLHVLNQLRSPESSRSSSRASCPEVPNLLTPVSPPVHGSSSAAWAHKLRMGNQGKKAAQPFLLSQHVERVSEIPQLPETSGKGLVDANATIVFLSVESKVSPLEPQSQQTHICGPFAAHPILCKPA